MKLTDLKLTKSEKKRRKSDEVPSSISTEEYPWGLNISLNRDSLSKLGLDLKAFTIGQKGKLTAEYVVTEIRESKERYNDESKNLGLQIQKLGIDKGKSKLGKFNDLQKQGPG